MVFNKIISSLLLVSAISLVSFSCNNPGAVQDGRVFTATLNSSQEVPPNTSIALGTATVTLSNDEKTATITYDVKGLSSTQTGAHIHGPAKPGENAGVVFQLSGPTTNVSLDYNQLVNLKSGLFYVNVHTTNFPDGEVRGQLASK